MGKSTIVENISLFVNFSQYEVQLQHQEQWMDPIYMETIPFGQMLPSTSSVDHMTIGALDVELEDKYEIDSILFYYIYSAAEILANFYLVLMRYRWMSTHFRRSWRHSN